MANLGMTIPKQSAPQEQQGLAQMLTQPTTTTPTVVERVREALTNFWGENQPPRNPNMTQWRDVRVGNKLNDYLKEQGID